MFTGIIEEIGVISQIIPKVDGKELVIKANEILSDVHLGDSIAVNGVCLTVERFSSETFTVFASKISSEITNIGLLKLGSFVNLERAMAANSRFGGHIVQGHVDGLGKINQKISDQNGIEFHLSFPRELGKYIVSKGAITIDGVSLTVVSVEKDSLILYLIPASLEHTTLMDKKVGDSVNVEVDVIGKYIEKLLAPQNSDSSLIGALKINGFM